MKLSNWIIVDDFCACRVLAGTDPEVQNRIAFIEKTPRVRLRKDTFAIQRTYGPCAKAEFDAWISGPKGSGGPADENHELAGNYGFNRAARAWCDDMLQLLGYDVPDPVTAAQEGNHTQRFELAGKDDQIAKLRHELTKCVDLLQQGGFGCDSAIVVLKETETTVPTIDLDNEAWIEIKRAASESKWMPPEYMKNDWVADLCHFLREGSSRTAPRVVITCDGGLVQEVISDIPISAAVIDYDVEGAPPEDLAKVIDIQHGTEADAAVSCRSVEVDPERVSKMLDKDAPERAE